MYTSTMILPVNKTFTMLLRFRASGAVLDGAQFYIDILLSKVLVISSGKGLY